MKSLITIIGTLFCLSSSIYSQEYIQFPADGAYWSIFLLTTCDNNSPPDTLLLQYTLDGDTTFNEKYYRKLLVNRGDTVNPRIEAVGGVRESDKKVYYFGKCFLGTETEKEFLLYDFGAKIGDTIVHSLNGFWKSVILEIDSIQIADQYRKRFKVDNGWFYHNPDYIVEGIGSISNGLLGHISDIPICGSHFWENVCYKEDGVLLYLNPSYMDCYAGVNLSSINSIKESNIRLFPNPFSESIQVHIQNERRDMFLCIYNSQGQMVVERLLINKDNQIFIPGSSGIYIAVFWDYAGLIYTKKVVKD